MVNILRRVVDPDSIDALCELLRAGATLIVNNPLMDLIPRRDIRHSVSCLWEAGNAEHREVLRDFLMRFTDREWKIAAIHPLWTVS
jgi:hypothetical protein